MNAPPCGESLPKVIFGAWLAESKDRHRVAEKFVILTCIGANFKQRHRALTAPKTY
ncbi:hypothetical protein XSR1_10360 [Xenorhabdus szentirmaii DSM 16338]|uniref:Uncharacterized protein n=1 Tax=Xenorhabdus szentirmaii DSM 16338 TaxID=1427518 RepID=W1ITL3_9GAMM|nr:hypothetical protein XSR1_10360 [Xenorhabdus szentirmaii DSM 16338]